MAQMDTSQRKPRTPEEEKVQNLPPTEPGLTEEDMKDLNKLFPSGKNPGLPGKGREKLH